MGLLLPLAVCLAISYLVSTAIYNLFFHPLAKLPGSFWAKISSIPSWYHAYKGDRHIWLWQQFQLYGRKFRATPNTVLFCSPEAYNDIYAYKANVKRSNFYEAWVRNEHDVNTLNCTDVERHAHKRRLLNLAFTDKSTKAAGLFMARHVDRWDDLLAPEHGQEWSESKNITTFTDYLMLDVLGDLAFGKNFETKEPGTDQKLKAIPHKIVEYVQFAYPIARSPFLEVVLWLKPRGLNKLMEAVTPKDIKDFYAFVEESVMKRIAAEKQCEAEKRAPEREDIFHFLCSAKDPDTGEPAFAPEELLAEAHLLIIAGSGTTAITICGVFFYLSRYPRVLQKLVNEVRSTFSSPEDIVHGPELASCEYLRAVIDESLRMTPSGPSELPRVVLPGGATIDGHFYPEGVIVGTADWPLGRNETLYSDAYTFRPERWIISNNLDTLNTEEDVLRIKRGFRPFSQGPGNCVGQKIAILQLSLAIARTLWRMDIRAAPGEHLGEGRGELGWGRRDPTQFMLRDAYISLRDGPMIQFRRRTDKNSTRQV